jgi:hypothetical protein
MYKSSLVNRTISLNFIAMNKSLFAVVYLLIASFHVLEAALSQPGPTDPPIRYTITHEATFDIVIKENVRSLQPIESGRIVIGLFGEIVPMTVLNFVTISNGILRTNVGIR